jgi:hypothetical protein
VAIVAVLLAALAAFEYPALSGSPAAMLAGAAVPRWQHSLTLNPALDVGPDRFSAGASFARPYGLPGLNWGRVGAAGGSNGLRLHGGLSILSLQPYYEGDAVLGLCWTLLGAVSAGANVHALAVRAGPDREDIVPAVDLGVCWSAGRFRAGAAGQRLNSPRWGDGTELPPGFTLASSWEPVDGLLLALDASRSGVDEDLAFGLEFAPIPVLGLCFGVGTTPLRFAAGLSIETGFVRFDYAYQFHPALKETHVLGLETSWR